MKLLEDMIRERGETRPGGIIKVDGFLNHRLDYELYREIGESSSACSSPSSRRSS